MFDFLKPKKKMRPEELGIVLANVLASQWFSKISDHVDEIEEKIEGLTDPELGKLWHLLLCVNCTAISVGVESGGVEETNKTIVLVAFWDSVRDILREHISVEDAEVFEATTANWHPQVREIILKPGMGFGNGSLGPGKILLRMALPDRDILRNIKTVDDIKTISGEDKEQYMGLVNELNTYFFSIVIALTKYATDCVTMTEFTKSMISYE